MYTLYTEKYLSPFFFFPPSASGLFPSFFFLLEGFSAGGFEADGSAEVEAEFSSLEVVTSKAGSVRGEFEMVEIHARNIDTEPSKQLATSKMGSLEVLASSEDRTLEYVHCHMTSDQVARAWYECKLGVRRSR